jgi:MFS family permease
VQTNSLKTLAIVVSIFFFTSNLSGSFLTVYYKELGLGIPGIITILLFTFPLIGLLPLFLLRSVKNFERIMSFGIFFTMLFYVVLIFIRTPIILGLAYGLSIATFWPSFNLLQFRLGESKVRARTVSLFSSIIPALTSIVGPGVGGFVIESFGFEALFITAVALYIIAFFLSLRIRFQPETHKFSFPRNRAFLIFFITFILLGLSEAYWLVYPLFVLGISGTVLNMGVVLALSAVLISATTFMVNWLSDIKKTRVHFAVIGAMLNAAWFFMLAFASTTYQIVGLSLLSGLASAFNISWFAYYGDSFSKEHHASILTLMEVGLMIGRIANLAPTYVFIATADYASYFRLSGVFLLFIIPLYVVSERGR